MTHHSPPLRERRRDFVVSHLILRPVSHFSEPNMSLDTLADAFYDELCDVYHAEKQLVKALPKMAKKASTPKLAAAFKAHLAETKNHVIRCEAAFKDTGKAPKAKKCEAMAGLVKEASEMM